MSFPSETDQRSIAQSRRLRCPPWTEGLFARSSLKTEFEIAAPVLDGPHHAPGSGNVSPIRVRMEAWRRATISFPEDSNAYTRTAGGRASGSYGSLANNRHGGATLRRALGGSLRAAACGFPPWLSTARRLCRLGSHGTAEHYRNRGGTSRPAKSPRASPRGPPRQPSVDKLAFSWKAEPP